MNIIDTHNHSLPGIDDGAKDLNMALDMLRVAQNSGTSDVILTPHHLNGAFNNFATDVKQAVEALKVAASDKQMTIRLHVGSEIHVVPETVEHLVENKALTYCGLGKAALIELPKNSIPTGVESILSDLIYNGITPVIAHPERNSTLRQDYGALREWVEFGCKTQVTGQSVSGRFGSSIQQTTLNMITDGLVHLVASDAHRVSGRSPNLLPAVEMITKLFDNEACELLFSLNPERLIRGEKMQKFEPLNSADKPATPKLKSNSRFSRWFKK